jgi:probable O-glycosylation ligase (exosortase A-associated)
MLRSLFLCLVYGAFLCGGLIAPFAAGLGYVWVDTFTPQYVAYSILTEIPVSVIMAVAAIGGYILMDRRSPPRPNIIMILTILMGLWVTFTTAELAVVPASAWEKWNWAIKTIAFSLFMPALFRSRIQIESFLQIYLFSLAAQFLPYAAKTVLSGGSYDQNLGLVAGNSGLAEGSTLSTVCLMLVPVVLWMRNHQLIFPQWRLTKLMYPGFAVALAIAAIGTFERTALVGMAVALGGLWLKSKHKLRYALIATAGIAIAGAYIVHSDSAWVERMSTIGQYNKENSALGRILVWQWTLGFVDSHPMGGGFNAYMVDTITVPTADSPEGLVIQGKAFHSMYFEMLGEHGWPGLGLFLSLLLATFWTFWRVARQCRQMPGMEWCRDLALSLMVSAAVLATCGAFIGIGFQPEVYYTFALAVMLSQHVRAVRRANAPKAAPLAEVWDEPLMLPA